MTRATLGYHRRSALIVLAKQQMDTEDLVDHQRHGWLTVDQAAAYVGDLSPNAIRYHVRVGNLPATVSPRWPYRTLIDPLDLAQFRHMLAQKPNAKLFRTLRKATS